LLHGFSPGKRLPDELRAQEAMRIAHEIACNEVPCNASGGEPLMVPHFLQLAETLGTAGVQLIETNGQQFDARVAERSPACRSDRSR
jgi:MoaA/NifB/PqqE/SkfB family radical SAM enzyme